MTIDPDTKQRLVGAALGALGVTAVYGIFRHREAILRPALAAPSQPTARVHVRRFKKKHGHRDNERGEYGHRRKRRRRDGD